MLTRMIGSCDHVRESETVYGYEYEYGAGGSNTPLQPTRAAQPNAQRGPAGSGPRR